MPNNIDSDNSLSYYSMMGLVKEEYLKSLYKPDGGWTKFRDMQDALDHMKKDKLIFQDGCAIPDIYGRAIQIGIILKSIDGTMEIYPYNQEITAWRGILAVIALQDYLNLPLELEYISYERDSNAFDQALNQPMNIGMFNNAIGWCDNIYYMLTLKRQGDEKKDDIAFFSPLTLVCPMANLSTEALKSANICWFQEESFQDPVQFMDDIEKSIVLYWLVQLQNTVSDWKNENDSQQKEWQNMILRHIGHYIADLNKNMKEQYRGNKNCFLLASIPSKVQDNIVNSVLNQTVKVEFKFTNNESISYKDIFSQKIYCSSGVESSFSGCAFNDKYNIKNSNRLFAFIPLGWNAQRKLSRKSIEQLVNCYEMEEVKRTAGDGESYYIAKFALSNISQDFIDIKKVYQKDECISEELPVIAMWPSSEVAECRKRYVYLEGGIKLAINDGKTSNNSYVWSFDDMPKTISLIKIIEDYQYDVGMILPNIPKKKLENVAVKSAIVGIDFGTSKTVVSVKIDDEEPYVIDKLQDTSEILVHSWEKGTTEENIHLATMGDYFIPHVIDDQLLYSIFRRPKIELLNNAAPILDGIIYRAGKDEQIKNEEFDLFMPDIKWNGSTSGAYYVAFIEELCMHIWLMLQKKGVCKVEWRYALPESLKTQNNIKSFWDNEITPFLKTTTTDNATFPKGPYSESIATSMYFLNYENNQDINRKQGYIVVDIGGGSTDIAVWKQNDADNAMQMVAHTSIPVAGRDLFTQYIALNLREIAETPYRINDKINNKLQRLCELNSWAKENQDASQRLKMCNSILEQIVQNNLSAIMDVYSCNVAWTPILRHQIEFGVAMLFFSLGSLVGQLLADNVLLDNNLERIFTIALGGYGSKILEWLEGSENQLLNVFQDGVKIKFSSGIKCKMNLIKSGNPKREVALGLVQDNIEHTILDSCSIVRAISLKEALDWNECFASSYTKHFRKIDPVHPEKIHNLVDNGVLEIDECNFIMKNLYKCYYDKIREMK